MELTAAAERKREIFAVLENIAQAKSREEVDRIVKILGSALGGQSSILTAAAAKKKQEIDAVFERIAKAKSKEEVDSIVAGMEPVEGETFPPGERAKKQDDDRDGDDAPPA